MTASRVGVLAVMDGHRITGPARQLLAAARPGRCANARITLGIFQRPAAATPFVAGARREDIPVIVLRDRFAGDPRTARALAALAARPETQILQTHGYKANVLAALAVRTARRPWIAFLHGETWENWKVRAYFALERLAVQRADRIVVVCHRMAAALRARGVPDARVRVVHNACLVAPSEGEHAAPDGAAPRVVGVVGRLSPEKGVDIALRVQQRLARRAPDARLWIVGEGPDRARLHAQAEQLGIAPAVDWLGYRDDMGALYRRMSVLLIPSRSEGLPNVALEAMAYGIPVVATAVGGVPEVVADGRTGFLTPPGDVEGLAARVLRLLENATLRRQLGTAARREATTRFSPDARGRALAELYQELVA
jgi:glycosyltransferase involved in cell wall biosynthesis